MNSRKPALFAISLSLLCSMAGGGFAASRTTTNYHKDIKYIEIQDVNNLQRIGLFDFSGNLQKAISWHDELGENILLFTEQKIVTVEPDGPVDSYYSKLELFVYHYFEGDGLLRLQRQVYDYMSGCGVKPESGFDFDSLSVTDIDQNGIGEISFVYKLLCNRENWGGSQVKLIMLENGQKFALRSEGRMQENGSIHNDSNVPAPGKIWSYTIDTMYEQAPPDFLKYSQLCWAEFGAP